MKEFGPVNQDRLTTQPRPSKLEGRGDIFMAEATTAETPRNPNETVAHLGRIKQQRIEREQIASEPDTGIAARSGIPEEDVRRLRLEHEINTYVANKVNGVEDPAARQGLVDRLMTEINASASIDTGQFPREILSLARHFKEVREMLINQILFKPFEDQSETNPYELGLYASDNLQVLLGYLSRDDPEQYAKFISLKNGAQLFHHMNGLIIAGNMGRFNEVAENVNYQHFQLMQEIPGISQVMRLYEQTYLDILARDKRITTNGYKELRDRVRTTFNDLNEKGLVNSEYKGERVGEGVGKMKPWELERALNAGRTFFNLTFRAAELIGQGQLPEKGEKGGEKRVGSFPQESAARLMNWMQLMTERFQIASTRGGVQFLHMVKTSYVNSLVERGLKKKLEMNKNKITEFGGVNVDDLENAGIFGISGIYSSWRLETMALTQLKMRITTGAGEIVDISIRDWLDGEDRYEVDNPVDSKINKRKYADLKPKKKFWEKDSREKEQDLLEISGREDDRATLSGPRKLIIDKLQGQERLNYLRTLINGTDIGLGILLKQGFATDKHGYEVRQAIWEKVANGGDLDLSDPTAGNTPLLIDYLTNFKITDGSIKTVDQIKDGDFEVDGVMKRFPWDAQAEGEPDGVTYFDVLKQKILLQHEINMRRTMGKLGEGVETPTFNTDEQNLIKAIKTEGVKLAPHLADIVFPYVPFMNDTPFELLDYSGPGEEFYKRRLGGDLPSYNKAQTGFIQLMNNPGGVTVEEGLKLIDGIVKGIESPQGTPDAQDRVAPLFSAWLEFIMTQPGQRQAIFKAVKGGLQKPTSLAQGFAGQEALSLNEAQIRTAINDAWHMGIVNRVEAEKEKKRKHAAGLGLFWGIFRDLFYIPVISGVTEFSKRTAKVE